MADGGLTLKLDDDLARKIERAAAAAGLTEEDFATHLIEQNLFDYDDYDWGGDDPRRVAISADEGGETCSLEEVMAEFRQELEQRLAAKA